MVPELTLYCAKSTAWSQRVTLTLAEVNAPHRHIEIDLQNKPDWLTLRVNPAGEVPVLQVGADNAEGTVYIPESLVILDLLSELYPNQLLPSSPILRAEARYFIGRFNQVATTPAIQILFAAAPSEADIAALFAGLNEVQSFLCRHAGPFVLGHKVSLGDLGTLPFAARLFAFGRAGMLPAGVWEKIQGVEYEVLRAWVEELVSRCSFTATFDEAFTVGLVKARVKAAKSEPEHQSLIKKLRATAAQRFSF